MVMKVRLLEAVRFPRPHDDPVRNELDAFDLDRTTRLAARDTIEDLDIGAALELVKNRVPDVRRARRGAAIPANTPGAVAELCYDPVPYSPALPESAASIRAAVEHWLLTHREGCPFWEPRFGKAERGDVSQSLKRLDPIGLGAFKAPSRFVSDGPPRVLRVYSEWMGGDMPVAAHNSERLRRWEATPICQRQGAALRRWHDDNAIHRLVESLLKGRLMLRGIHDDDRRTATRADVAKGYLELSTVWLSVRTAELWDGRPGTPGARRTWSQLEITEKAVASESVPPTMAETGNGAEIAAAALPQSESTAKGRVTATARALREAGDAGGKDFHRRVWEKLGKPTKNPDLSTVQNYIRKLNL